MRLCDIPITMKSTEYSIICLIHAIVMNAIYVVLIHLHLHFSFVDVCFTYLITHTMLHLFICIPPTTLYLLIDSCIIHSPFLTLAESIYSHDTSYHPRYPHLCMLPLYHNTIKVICNTCYLSLLLCVVTHKLLCLRYIIHMG